MILTFAGCTLDTDRQSLSRGGAPVPVEPQVFDLLRLLAENPGRLVTRDEIVEVVWSGRAVSESAISARIAAARKAVGDDGQRQAVIRTVQRRGLEMAVPVETAATTSGPDGPPPGPAAPSMLRVMPARGGKRLTYALDGAGPPVLRVDAPGWSFAAERSSPIWHKTTDWLNQHHRQLRYATEDIGQAGGGPPVIDQDAMAEDIAALVDTVGWDRFAIMTESGGVHHAVRFAAAHPERVTRLVIHGGYVEGRARRAGGDPRDDIFRHLVDQGWEGDAAQIGAAFMLPYFPEGPFEAIVEAARIFQQSNTREEELAQRDAVNAADCGPYLGRITCPVLIVHGRHGAVHPLSEAQKLAAGLPDAELWVLETANHLPVFGHRLWKEYTAGLLDFLAEDGKGGTADGNR